MTETRREEQLLQAFAALADTLVADYDIVELLQTLVETCRDLLDATASGVLLANEDGDLELLASTSEASRLVELMQLSADAGPCIESYLTGRTVSLADITLAPESWQRFRDEAIEQGFASVFAVPMRLRDTTIGTLNLLRDVPGELPDGDIVAAQAFADVATIGILHERAIAETRHVREQLQHALDSRIVIEQAKGVIAQMHKIPVDEAFTVIRAYARQHRLGLSTVAARIVDRTLDISAS
jgi:GAF domain-containing protein